MMRKVIKLDSIGHLTGMPTVTNEAAGRAADSNAVTGDAKTNAPTKTTASAKPTIPVKPSITNRPSIPAKPSAPVITTQTSAKPRMPVTVTQISPKVTRSNTPSPLKTLRVAAYCRVSTDSDAQLESLDAQRSHYSHYISKHPEWKLAGIYYDEGISGTKKEKRPELLRLLADCEAGRIDFVVTKSISRLARNTTDSLELVRHLKSLGIPIYFEKENINTFDMEGELLLTVMSSMAEGESISISENNKWSVVRRYKNGTFKLFNPPYGYDWDGKNLVINEEQAKHVRWIFAQVLAGVPLTRVAESLNDKGLRTVKGNAWQAGTLRDMISNERYVGDVIFQKKYTDSRFYRHVNRGEVNQYMLTDHHEPIVSREVFDAANALIERNRNDRGIESETDKYLKRYPFSGKIICGICGKPFKRRVQNGYTAWWCSGHMKDKDSCDMKYVREDGVEKAFLLMLNKLTFGCRQILRPYYAALKVDRQCEHPQLGDRGESSRARERGEGECVHEQEDVARGNSNEHETAGQTHSADLRHSVDLRHNADLRQALSDNSVKQKNLIRLASQGLIDEALFSQERAALDAEAKAIRKQMQADIEQTQADIIRMQADMDAISRNNEKLKATRALIHLVEKKTDCTDFDGKNSQLDGKYSQFDGKYSQFGNCITVFDEKLFEAHVDHIRVESRDSIVFVLKCGLELRERLAVVDGRRK